MVGPRDPWGRHFVPPDDVRDQTVYPRGLSGATSTSLPLADCVLALNRF